MEQDTNSSSTIPQNIEKEPTHRTDVKTVRRDRLIIRGEKLVLWIPILIGFLGIFCGIMILIGEVIDGKLNFVKVSTIIFMMSFFAAFACGVRWLIKTIVQEELDALNTEIDVMTQKQKAQAGALSIGHVDGKLEALTSDESKVS